MRKSIIRQVLTTLVLVGAVPAYLHGQTCPDAKKVTSGLKGPIITIRYLADDALEGRLAGSQGERCAGDFIAARFKELGLKPFGDKGSYFQSFELASVANPHAPKANGRNVVGVLEGSDPQLKNEYIVVGAHYDHLGWGPFGSLSPDEHAIHNGADDNASGTAAMIEVARLMKKGPKPARSILFLAFTGEEEGLLGSAHYASAPVVPLANSRGMLNMDMVGRLGQGPLIVYGVGTAKEWKQILNDEAAKKNIKLTLIDDGYGASDHTSFYLKDVPVLHFFSNVHSDYHKPSDDWDKIDRVGLENIAQLVTTVARDIANKQMLLTLVKGAGKPPGSDTTAATSRESGYGASLGTVPDFAPIAYGVKISGTRANGAAEKAGLKGGDVIIKFDGDDIKDLQAMTEGLRKRKPGDEVKITVLRDGKPMVFTAVLQKR